MKINEVNGCLISMALKNKFDVIAHGVNCFCTQKSGLAPQMVEAFGTDKFEKEKQFETNEWYDDGLMGYREEKIPTNNKGDINKLGTIDFQTKYIWSTHPSGNPVAMNHKSPNQKGVFDLIIVNAYTQYRYGTGLHLDYEALTLCMRKINHQFKGMHIGLPKIGSLRAGGDWNKIKAIIEKELKDCQVTIVHYEG